jgi:hypothetical protein
VKREVWSAALAALSLVAGSVPSSAPQRESKPLTDADREALAAAEAKRARKRARRQAQSGGAE